MIGKLIVRTLLAGLLSWCWAGSLSAQALPTRGSLDPVFARIPFEKWFSGEQAHIKWSTEVAEPVLSPHQRLLTHIRMTVDGQDLVQRRGNGEFAMLIQLRDSSGALWQGHDALELSRLQDGMKANDIEYSQSLFILPGEYEVSMAIFDTATGEHAGVRRKFRVPGVKNEPLPDAWKDLPAVEFINTGKPPDAWYLPSIKGRLHLVARPQHPIAVEILVNLTPSERFSGTNRSQDRSLSLLVPAAKMLAGADWGDAMVRVSFLDITHRRVAFEEELRAGDGPERGRQIDWDKAREAFAELTPGLVDVKTLENRKYSADFFTGEIRKRIEGPAGSAAKTAPRRVVIVLTSPVAFNSGVDRNPIEAEPGDDFRVYYVRYHPFTNTVIFNNNPAMGFPNRGRNPFGGGDEVILRPPPPGSQDDQLAPLLKGIRPELFDVLNADQFRKALAGILAEISRL